MFLTITRFLTSQYSNEVNDVTKNKKYHTAFWCHKLKIKVTYIQVTSLNFPNIYRCVHNVSDHKITNLNDTFFILARCVRKHIFHTSFNTVLLKCLNEWKKSFSVICLNNLSQSFHLLIHHFFENDSFYVWIPPIRVICVYFCECFIRSLNVEFPYMQI